MKKTIPTGAPPNMATKAPAINEADFILGDANRLKYGGMADEDIANDPFRQQQMALLGRMQGIAAGTVKTPAELMLERANMNATSAARATAMSQPGVGIGTGMRLANQAGMQAEMAGSQQLAITRAQQQQQAEQQIGTMAGQIRSTDTSLKSQYMQMGMTADQAELQAAGAKAQLNQAGWAAEQQAKQAASARKSSIWTGLVGGLLSSDKNAKKNIKGANSDVDAILGKMPADGDGSKVMPMLAASVGRLNERLDKLEGKEPTKEIEEPEEKEYSALDDIKEVMNEKTTSKQMKTATKHITMIMPELEAKARFIQSREEMNSLIPDIRDRKIMLGAHLAEAFDNIIPEELSSTKHLAYWNMEELSPKARHWLGELTQFNYDNMSTKVGE